MFSFPWPHLYRKIVPGKIYCKINQPAVQTEKAYLYLTVLNLTSFNLAEVGNMVALVHSNNELALH